MFHLVPALVLVFTSLPTPGEMQGNGDLRLAGKDTFANRTNIGRLEIFLDGEWGTVCGPIGDSFFADIACEQLGLDRAVIYGSIQNVQVSEAKESTPILIEFDTCFDVEHVLKCPYTRQVSEYCIHKYDAAVQCEGPSDLDIYWDTQVRLVNGTWPSSGVLEVYLFEHLKWGTVCSSDFNQAAADSACRQLGYTNATSFTGVDNPPGSTVWLSSTRCSNSQPCFNYCFPNYPEAAVSRCSGQGTVVFLNCTFDVSQAKLSNTGSESTCGIYVPRPGSFTHYFWIGVGIGALAFVVFIIVIVIVAGVLLFKYRSRHSHYVQVNSGGDVIDKSIQ